MTFATRTLTIVDEPTKCFLSNRTTSFPYVAAMVHAAIVTTSLYYILHKGILSPTLRPHLLRTTGGPPGRNPGSLYTSVSALEKAWLNLATNASVFIPLPTAAVVIPFLASSWLRGFIWMAHYTGHRAGFLPSFSQIQQALTWIQGPLYPVDYAMLLGPTFVHLGLLFLLAVYRLPFRIIKNDIGAIWGCISDPRKFDIRALRATGCTLKRLLAGGFILASLCFATQLCLLTADIRRLLSFAFSCSESRRMLWGLAGYQLKRYGAWKSIQIYSIPNRPDL
ncbi:hypothetical protein C8F04DRAFT_1336779 [Mycena alexandri]|uniref:Uncharacterized protein n=1 Tax=Mycena alexandri TaxID=1745969 RepID=A0AAD6RXY0_9AGAR|nr:hypothetical protein C8F04DRAFT_1336779 [Mycena alexandri]